MPSLSELGAVSKAQSDDDKRYNAGRRTAAAGLGGLGAGAAGGLAALWYGPGNRRKYEHWAQWQTDESRRRPQTIDVTRKGRATAPRDSDPGFKDVTNTSWGRGMKSYMRDQGFTDSKNKVRVPKDMMRRVNTHRVGTKLAGGAALGGAAALAASPVIGGVNSYRKRSSRKRASDASPGTIAKELQVPEHWQDVPTKRNILRRGKRKMKQPVNRILNDAGTAVDELHRTDPLSDFTNRLSKNDWEESGIGTMTSLAELGAINKAHIAKKAKFEEDEVNPQTHRRGMLNWANPRSRTYVERGTGAKRAGRAVGGGLAGGAAGGTAGSLLGAGIGALTRKPGAAKTGAAIGGEYGGGFGALGGGSAGLSRNIKQGNTIGVNRRTGERAKWKYGSGLDSPGMYIYPNKKDVLRENKKLKSQMPSVEQAG